jgi:hypothetical protein
MPYAYTPIVLLVLGGALTVLGAALGPETRDADIHAEPARRVAETR